MIVEDCKVGDHSNALEIAYEMEAAGRMATTFHFNCLLSVQVIPCATSRGIEPLYVFIVIYELQNYCQFDMLFLLEQFRLRVGFPRSHLRRLRTCTMEKVSHFPTLCW